MRATRALIHIDNFRNNIREIKRVSKAKMICVAVKADAYGHGAARCAKAAVEEGADFLAVATAGEGAELRREGIAAPILMLSLCSPEEVLDAVRNKITPLVFDEEYASLFDSACKAEGLSSYPVHIAVDTGMGRVGCLPSEAGKVAKKIAAMGSLKIEGCCTHFASSDEAGAAGRSYAARQLSEFNGAIKNIREAGIDPGIRHCANSAACLDLGEARMDMVRPGIICYGYYPGDLDRAYFEKKGTPIDLRPAMTLETRISCIREFDAGKSVSYGMEWTSSEKTRIAVLPVGYADGLLRRFARAGVGVAIGGREFPIRGRICMDQCMVDLGSAEAERWQAAVIFGDPRFGALQTADDIARKTGTISYEITSLISRRAERVYLEGEFGD